MAVKTTVVTGWAPTGWDEYGRRFTETFDRHWPKSVDLISYVWEAQALPRGEARIMPADVQGFLYRHRENRKAAGKEYVQGWREKHIKSGYCFRFDALKFCQMAMYPWHAAQSVKDGILVWLDGDVVTNKNVPEGWVNRLLGPNSVAYLGRVGAHSEIGFTAYRLPAALPLLKRFHDIYATDEVFTLPEWHSAYCFDIARREAERIGLRCLNLTPRGTGHVWMQSPLVEYTDHLKGKRKVLDASPERANARKA
jgi:hypothetical protein